MKTNEGKQLVTQALETLVSAIEKGESEQLKAYLAMLARSHRYSVGNVLLIAMQRPGATRVAEDPGRGEGEGLAMSRMGSDLHSASACCSNKASASDRPNASANWG